MRRDCRNQRRWKNNFTLGLDDDGPIEATDSTTASEGTGEFLLYVRRGDNGPNPASVDYTITEESARLGDDYVAAGRTVTFQPGERFKTIPITLIDGTYPT